MAKTEIYYFSGTGNSLFVAKELQKRIPDSKLIPLVRLLDNPIKVHAETIGIVFPIHFTMMPNLVKQFVKRLELKNTNYVFAVATRIGTPHSSFESISNILKKKGRKLNLQFSINMASNDPKFNYKCPTKKDIAKLENEAIDTINSMYQKILKKKDSDEIDKNIIQPVNPLFVKLVPTVMAIMNGIGIQSKYYADSKCKGCGTCEKVCLSKKIKIVDMKPVWQKKIQCFNCAACLNFCPEQAVQIKSFTEKNERYPHPYATVNDIANQK